MNKFTRRGIIFVVSAPSGTGKSTVCNGLRQTSDLVYSVSCTTRPPRKGEIEGEDYFFISKTEFKKRIERQEFLEYAEVHGNYYGTLLSEVERHTSNGTDILLDIDVQGARAIRSHPSDAVRESLVDIFIMPPTVEELEHRLRKRGTETEKSIKTRLKASTMEMSFWQEYKYTILSGSIEEDLIKFRSIIRAERYLSRRLVIHHE